MVGMIPTMVVLMNTLPDAGNPYHLLFWGVMSVATIAGMITAYPINSWMVSKGLKHGMMSAIPSPKAKSMDMSGDKQHSNHISKLSTSQSTIVLIATFGLLIFALICTNLFASISFIKG
ncbi:DUF4396 domain-containing protein [Sulfurimonas sp.]